MLHSDTHTFQRPWRHLFGRKDLPASPGETSSPRIRLAGRDDEPALAALAELDSARPPRGPVLVAESGGDLLAAVSLDDNHVVADPFRPTGELAFLLLARGRELRRAHRGRQEQLVRVWPRDLSVRTG